MRVPGIIALLGAVAITGVAADDQIVTGTLGNATIVENNPPGVVYRAVLPQQAFAQDAYPFGGNVKGEILATGSPDGIGVLFKVRFSNLPKEGGPFPYHIHVNPVSGDGNCTETLAHLDPYIRGEDPPCNGNLTQTCQVGDLAGKHGKIDRDPYEATYTELYASTAEGIGAFFGNRSFVVHFSNKTRISCANFQQVAGGSGTNFTAVATSSCANNFTGQATPTSSGSALFTSGFTSTVARPTVSTITVSAGSRYHLAGGATAVLAFAAAIMLAL